jgi:hypothetical protein
LTCGQSIPDGVEDASLPEKQHIAVFKLRSFIDPLTDAFHEMPMIYRILKCKYQSYIAFQNHPFTRLIVQLGQGYAIAIIDH